MLEDENRRVMLINEAFCRGLAQPRTPAQLVGTDGAHLAEESFAIMREPAAYQARIAHILARRELVLGDVLELRLYGIPGKVSVPSTGEVKRVQIGSEDLDPTLVVRTVPRLDTLAYLYARMTVPKTGGPLLPGAVSLFRDGTFVGQGRLPQLAAGEDHELGFGADDLIKVKRVVIEDKKGESGVFTTTRAEERNYTISVKNLRANAVIVQVIDRIPVSMQQDIKVDVTYKPQPTRKDISDRRGTLAWDLTLAPEQEQQISFGYKVTTPAGKTMQYRELSQQHIQDGNQSRVSTTTKF